MKKIVIRSYKKNDELNFFKLDREIEEHPHNRRSVKNFLWKFKGQNPFGKAVNFFSYQGKKIIAHFGAVPLKWIIKNKEILGSCSIAMMVKPEWQNKGLVKFIGDKVFESLKKNKIVFVYGYPNQKALALHIKFWNYSNFINQKTYTLKKRIKITSNIFQTFKVTNFTKKYDLFWNNNKNDYEAILDRNSKFLNWRYLNRPDKKYFCYYVLDNNGNIVGYFVLKSYKLRQIKKMHIIDIFVQKLDKDNLKNVCLSIIDRIYKHKLNENEISFWLNGNNKLVNIFKSIGFEPTTVRPMIIKHLVQKNSSLNKISAKNFYFTMGDTLEIY